MQSDIARLAFVTLTLALLYVIAAQIVKPGGSFRPCPAGQSYNKMCGSCTGDAICTPPLKWDCKAAACSCPASEPTVCGDKCCSVCDKPGGVLCCAKQNVGKDPLTGKAVCCAPGSAPNAKTGHCNAICFPGGTKTCADGEECVSIDHLSNESFNSLKSSLTSNKVTITHQVAPTSKRSDGKMSYCKSSTATGCIWNDAVVVPAPIENNHLYYNWSHAEGAGASELCFPRKVGGDQTCFAKDKATCKGECVWKNATDYFAENPTEAGVQLHQWQSSLSYSPMGWYCDKGGAGTQNLVQLQSVSAANAACNVHDCITRVSNQGTTQVKFDDSKKRCTAMKSTSPGGIDLPHVFCTDRGDPCDACTAPGDLVDRDKCVTARWSMSPCKREPTKSWPTGNCPQSSEYLCQADGQVTSTNRFACDEKGSCVQAKNGPYATLQECKGGTHALPVCRAKDPGTCFTETGRFGSLSRPCGFFLGDKNYAKCQANKYSATSSCGRGYRAQADEKWGESGCQRNYIAAFDKCNNMNPGCRCISAQYGENPGIEWK